jgi:cytochrome P450
VIGTNSNKSTIAPVLDVDPFADDFLRDPDPYHERLRVAGPVAYLERYGVWAMARFAEVRHALRDHQTFCSGAGVGLSDFRREKPWRPPSLLLEADQPAHTRARRATSRALSPRALEDLRPGFDRAADELVASLLSRDGVPVDGVAVDGVQDIARAYTLRVFPDAVGLAPDGRENLIAYGEMVFNAFGPRNRLFEESMAAAEPVRAWIADRCRREALRPDGLGAQLYAAADAGEVTEEEAGLLVRSLLSAGIDTTVHALAFALYALSDHPEQWRALRRDASLVRPAFEETLRYASPVQTFFRTTTRAVTVGATTIPAGEKVLLFIGAANRDPRRWADADRFDVRRRAAGHLGFGTGIHACVGAAVARIEAAALLAALARRVTVIERTGAATPRLNNTVRGLAALPLRLHR